LVETDGHDVEEGLQEQVIQVVEQWIRSGYSGPIPPPNLLKEYERLFPGLQEKIVDAALVSPERRQDRLVESEISTRKRGQTGAFIGAGVCLAAAIAFGLLGNNVLGIAFLGPPLVQLVSSFFGRGGRRDATDD